MKIGVLALQGDFDAHRRRLEELGAQVVLVKKPEQLDEIDGLVIPGGESGTFLKLLGEAGFEKLKRFARTKPTAASSKVPSAKANLSTKNWESRRLKWFSSAPPRSGASDPESK